MNGDQIAAFATLTEPSPDGVIDGSIIARGFREEVVLPGDDPDDMVVAIAASQPLAVLIGRLYIVEQTRVLSVRLDGVTPGDDRRDIEAVLSRLFDDGIDIREEGFVRLRWVDVSLPVVIVGLIMGEKRSLTNVEALRRARAQIQVDAIGCYLFQPPCGVPGPEKGKPVLPLDATPVVGHL